jgi:hypothetical protein
LLVTLFLEAHARPPRQIIPDLDATDDPLHGHQEGRFFHGYYDCYCYLPLYVFCGRHLLAAKLRPSDIDASAGSVDEVARIVTQIRARWPHVRILLRADFGLCARGVDGVVRRKPRSKPPRGGATAAPPRSFSTSTGSMRATAPSKPPIPRSPSSLTTPNSATSRSFRWCAANATVCASSSSPILASAIATRRSWHPTRRAIPRACALSPPRYRQRCAGCPSVPT